MGLHLAMFHGTGSITVDVDMVPVIDQVIPVASTQFQLPRSFALVGAGARTDDVPNTFPSVMVPGFVELPTVGVTPVSDVTDDVKTMDLSLSPIDLAVGEPIGATLAVSTGTPEVSLGLFLSDRLEPAPSGPASWVRYGVTSGALAADSTRWQAATLTPIFRLAAGKYRILGIRFYHNNVVAGRLILADSVLRPGALAVSGQSLDALPATLPAIDTTGILGTFDAVALPLVELYVPTAASGTVGFMDLMLQRVR
ncbi:MAG: hypothetical protein H6747_01630 [Deltaproteobacteria bacterium]|nr:hypothetical protein [Deltaproteobacteria bacterium]